MSKLEPDIWIRQNGDIYEYIYIYVDDLVISARYYKSLINALEKCISSRLRERDQFNFTLDVIYSMKVMLFYALPHTNILTIWSRHI